MSMVAGAVCRRRLFVPEQEDAKKACQAPIFFLQ
jgi:hypothetical protein